MAPHGVAARIEVRRRAGAPPIAVVVREGDPAPALAALLLVEDGAAHAAPALAALLEERLERAGVGAEARVARSAIVVTADLDLAAPARTVELVRAALALAVTPLAGDTPRAVMLRAAELAGPLQPPGLARAARCAGWAEEPVAVAAATTETIDLATPGGAAEIERLRAASVTASRASIAVVGTEAAVALAIDALAAPGWPAGPAWAPRADPAPFTSVFPALGVDPRPRAVVLAIDLPRATTAPAMARAVGAPESALASRLRVLAPGFAITSATGIARAGGGGSCLRLDLEAARTEALDAASAALAADVVRRALAASGPAAGEDEIVARAVLAASDPREAATRAAWWATTRDGSSAPLRAAVALEVAPSAPADAVVSELTRAVEQAEARTTSGASPERRTRVEAGQGALRMIVATPCAAGMDGDVAAAETAIALVATARRSADRGVELAPFVDGTAAGLSARADARPGESPGALARRVGEALARALAGPSPTASDLADARSRLVEHASGGFGHAEAADALSRALAPGRPTVLAPLGLEIPLVRADAEKAGARLTALLRAPLRTAVIANLDAAQGEAAHAAFAAHLPQVAAPPCAASGEPLAAAGRTDVRVPADAPWAQIAFGITATAGAAAADVAVELLGAADGPVARAAASVGGSARATRFGAGGVTLDVRVSPERVEDAMSAVTQALAAVARGEIAEASLLRARSAAADSARARAADPEQRLRALWLGDEPPRRAVPVDVRAVAADLGPARWTVVVARPG